MSIHAKRAAVVVVLVTLFTVVRIARPLLMAGSGGLGAVSFGPAEVLVVFVAPALIMGVLVYWLSRRSSRGPIARR